MDNSIVSTHNEDFATRFFSTQIKPTDEVAGIIATLKKENEKTGFVNKLPANCGLPVWNKIALQKAKANSGAITQSIGLTDTIIVIPLTENNKELSSIIIAKGNSQNGYTTNCYTQNYLYQLTHNNVVNTADAEKALLIFFFMENKVFQTTSFYHIPATLFAANTKLDADGNKTIKIKPDSLGTSLANFGGSTSSSYVICVYTYHCVGTFPCIPSSNYCDACNGCLTISCTPVGGEGGECPWCLPPPPPDGGGGTGGGGGPICNSTFYIINPTNCNPPPPVPNPCDSVIGSLETDANFKANFQWLTTNNIISQDHEFGFAVANRAQNIYVQKEGQPNSESIDWGISSNTWFDGFLHSHFCETTTNCLSPMFSPQDVVQMAQVFLTGHARDTNNLFFGVASGSGNPYLIKITNTAAFRTFAQKITGADGKDENKIRRFKETYKNKLNSTDMAENELEFLNMLEKEGGINGLGFYRSYGNCHNWQKLGLDGVGGTTVLNCY